jgi:hypothetical protein
MGSLMRGMRGRRSADVSHGEIEETPMPALLLIETSTALVYSAPFARLEKMAASGKDR